MQKGHNPAENRGRTGPAALEPPLKLTCRAVIRTGALAVAAPAASAIRGLATPAAAQEKPARKPTRGRGTTASPCSGSHNIPKACHFAYVNPNAPKGGRVRQIAFGTYDTPNLVRRREGFRSRGGSRPAFSTR